MAHPPENRCPCCQQSLPAGSSYCLVCGFDRSDADAKKLQLSQKAEQRIERARSLGRLFRFFRWARWLR
ncbi:MAG: hypothetical protein MI861_19895 [Pirellulales bacterium]|nr:hypothetical protein [Pirellulales bacterium]